MKDTKSTLIIQYPNGSTQVVKPNMQIFNGSWEILATELGVPYLTKEIEMRVNSEKEVHFYPIKPVLKFVVK